MPYQDVPKAGFTLAFSVLSCSQFYAHVCRKQSKSMLKIVLLGLPWPNMKIAIHKSAPLMLVKVLLNLSNNCTTKKYFLGVNSSKF